MPRFLMALLALLALQGTMAMTDNETDSNATTTQDLPVSLMECRLSHRT